MYQALRATSLTLAEYLRARLRTDPALAPMFDPGLGGAKDVFLNTPEEMVRAGLQGLSLWLYRLNRDEFRLNDPPRRVGFDRVERHRLPLRLYYLVTPIVTPANPADGPAVEQLVLGSVLQAFHDRPLLRGADLVGELVGTDAEVRVRFQPMTLEEITRVWDALEQSYQLCLTYEMSIAWIASREESAEAAPVTRLDLTAGVAAPGGAA
jgi:hypothetical protein